MQEQSNISEGSRLETVIIFTHKMEDLAAFYQEALDIGPFERAPGHMGCQLGPVYFGFDQVEVCGERSGSGVTVWFTVDDIVATFDRLVDMGVEVRYPPTEKPWGALLASVFDPDGNVLGLSQRR